MDISEVLDENIKYFEETYEDCGDIVKRKFPIGANKALNAFIIYVDNMCDRSLIDKGIMESFMFRVRQVKPDTAAIINDLYSALKDGDIIIADITEVETLEELDMAILSGDAALLIDKSKKAIIINSKGFDSRGVSEASTEVVVQGSKDSFSEVLRTNTCLIRRRIRDTNLKVKQIKAGRRTKTDIALMYIKDLVRPKVLNDALERLNNIDIDGILDIGYIEQLIEDNWMSPFPQCQVTERPDKASAAILEGRIVIIADNSPFVLIIPATMNTFFQSSEDYYQRFEIMSFVRLIRYASGIITVCLPAFYIAVAAYHPSMLPMFLMLKMAGARAGVPFPTVVEVLIMDLAFELLREAGIRLPGPAGGTIGIVGGIIIGQAAVEAGLVSPIVVIIVALTGIASFAIPHVSLVNGFRLIKYVLIFFSAILGLFGFWIGLILVLIHLTSLKSFGIPYLFPYVSGSVNQYSDMKDTLIRLPLFMMKKRPFFAKPGNSVRINMPNVGNTHKKE